MPAELDEQADFDEGRRSDGQMAAERAGLVELRRELRVAKLENEILKRAAAYFARENVLPKIASGLGAVKVTVAGMAT